MGAQHQSEWQAYGAFCNSSILNCSLWLNVFLENMPSTAHTYQHHNCGPINEPPEHLILEYRSPQTKNEMERKTTKKDNYHKYSSLLLDHSVNVKIQLTVNCTG